VGKKNSIMGVLVDTNVLIYHLAGSSKATAFLTELIARQAFNISILTKIEFLGWDKHTPEGFEKSKKLVELCQEKSLCLSQRRRGRREKTNLWF
jgi:predicted nucleic acid-binding protein